VAAIYSALVDPQVGPNSAIELEQSIDFLVDETLEEVDTEGSVTTLDQDVNNRY
jgi:hypothetical protein